MRALHHLKNIRMAALACAIVALPFSIRLSNIALVISLVLIFLEFDWRHTWKGILTHPIVLLFAVFFLLHVLGMIYTEDRETGWRDVEKKLALILAPLGAASALRFKSSELRILFLMFIGACLAGTIICLINSYGLMEGGRLYSGADVHTFLGSEFWKINANISTFWAYFSYEQLSSGIGIHPTYFSMYLGFCALLLFRLFHKRFYRESTVVKCIIAFVFLYLGVMIIFLSSKITLLAFLLIAGAGMFQTIRGNVRVKLAGVTATIVFFGGLIALNPVSRYRCLQEIPSTTIQIPPSQVNTMNTSIRTSLWWTAIRSVGNVNLLWGAGTGDVRKVMDETATEIQVTNKLNSKDPHDQFLNTLLGLGFVGLSILLVCLALPAYWAFQAKNYFYIGFWGLFVLVCLTESTFEFQKGVAFFSLFNSLLIFHDAKWPFTLSKSPRNI